MMVSGRHSPDASFFAKKKKNFFQYLFAVSNLKTYSMDMLTCHQFKETFRLIFLNFFENIYEKNTLKKMIS